jgi:Na+/proline symporter
MEILNFDFNFEDRYTVWTGIIGGGFLALSYFGTDQSQVQRYLTASSVRQSQIGMLFNGLLKVPMQFFILLVGIMVFVFYQFNASPIHFNPAAVEAVQNSTFQEEFKVLETNLNEKFKSKKEIIEQMDVENISTVKYDNLKTTLAQLNVDEKEIRTQAKAIIEKVDENIETNDTDYVFIHFILNNLPRGLIGLLLAAILSAAMSSTASELNALASTTAIDLYKRNVKSPKSDLHILNSSKLFTLGWGILAIIVACIAPLFENLIELVNIIGSIFYGNVLGVFLLAFFVKFVKSNATFISALITQTIIVLIFFLIDDFPYLWLNLIGCGLVMLLGILIQAFKKGKS